MAYRNHDAFLIRRRVALLEVKKNILNQSAFFSVRYSRVNETEALAKSCLE